jgi:hypothetical protein
LWKFINQTVVDVYWSLQESDHLGSIMSGKEMEKRLASWFPYAPQIQGPTRIISPNVLMMKSREQLFRNDLI